ncbi:MAG: hypothetical protein K5745_04215 [Saccharofermentans sp.]|nr:hypothetical protein [Saccharofermentans sp.]
MSDNNIFRKKTLDRLSSPDKLTQYLKVTNPGIWFFLGIVILSLTALFLWAGIGTLKTTANARVNVTDHLAYVVIDGSNIITEGMTLSVRSEEYDIVSTGTDEYGRTYGITEVMLPDGSYDGTVVVDEVRPIEFLLQSK